MGERLQKSFSFVSDGDEFSPFPFLPVKHCPCRVGLGGKPPPFPPTRCLPAAPPEQSSPRCTSGLTGQTPRSPSRAHTPALPRPRLPPPRPGLPVRLHCLPGRERVRREDQPEPSPGASPPPGDATWAHSVDLRKKWGRWGRLAPGSCAAPSDPWLWSAGWRQTRGAGALLGASAVIDFPLERDAVCIDAPFSLVPRLEVVRPVDTPLFPQAKLRVSTLFFSPYSSF